LLKIYRYISPFSEKSERHLHNVDKENLPFKTIHIDNFGMAEKKEIYFIYTIDLYHICTVSL